MVSNFRIFASSVGTAGIEFKSESKSGKSKPGRSRPGKGMARSGRPGINFFIAVSSAVMTISRTLRAPWMICDTVKEKEVVLTVG